VSKFVGIIVGTVAVVAGIAITVLSGGALVGVAAMLVSAVITAGSGMLLSGIGTLISGSGSSTQSQQPGFTTTTRNPISAFVEGYGQFIIGGTVVHLNEFGDSDKYLDMVIVLAARACQAVDTLLFDGQPVQMSTGGGAFTGIGDSFTPLQQTVGINHITRVKDVVTVTMAAAIPLLNPGDKVIVKNISGDHTLNGTFPVESVGGGGTIFTYINGGNPAIVDFEGDVRTLWPDYGRKVHMEVLLGDHTATFPGMISGTANDGDTTDLIVNSNNPWTADHKLLGKCCVFLRLHYNDTYFSGGLPQISFLMRGAKDVYDPRTSTYGYTENAALCIADYLSNTSYGFKATYGTEIPLTPLIAAANICDETVALAIGGFEPRYALNGKFDLNVKRGEVLQNMLTACAGRLTYQGGQFIIWPAAWNGSSPAPSPSLGAMSGPFRWKSTVSIRDLYNGVKGTYICPANNWQASDIPPYAQDSTHGYASGPAWSGSTVYVVGNIVQYAGVGYIALISATGHQPDVSPTYWAPHYQDANLTADGGDRRWLDIQLPFTISASTAQRLCKIELLRRRHQGTGTFRYNMAGYGITTMDVISMTIPYMGWSGKLFEVLAHRFTLDKQSDGGNEVTLLGTEIDVQETDASVFDWSDTEELTPQGYQQPAVPDARQPAPPTGLTLESDESTVVVTPQGLADAIVVTWTEPTDGYVLNGGHMEIQYELIENYSDGTLSATNGALAIVGTGTVWTSDMDGETIAINGVPYAIGIVTDNTHMTLATNFLGTTGAGLLYVIAFGSAWIGLPSVNASVTKVVINGVIDAEQYNVQIRSVNAGGTPSAWVVAGPVTATGANAPLPLKPYAESYAFAPHGFGFKLSQIQGSSGTQSIAISGQQPVNVLSATLEAPTIDPYAVVTTNLANNILTGSQIAQVFPVDALGKYGPGSNFTQFETTAPTQQVSFTCTFPTGAVKYEIFIGGNLDTLIGQGIQTVGSATLVINAIASTGYGPPDPKSVKYHATGRRTIHAGIAISAVISSTSTGVLIGIPSPAAADQFAGRYLIVVGKSGLPTTQIFSIIPITHNDTGSPNCSLTVPFPLGSLVGAGDLVLIGTAATAVTSTSITDNGFVSPFAPGGLAPHTEIGQMVMVLYDPTGASIPGDQVKATDNSTTGYTTTPWRIAPGIGTVFITVEPTLRASVVTAEQPNSVAPVLSTTGNTPLVSIPAADLQGYVALVQLRAQDANGNDSDEAGDGFRMMYIVPTPGSGGSDGEYLIPVTTISTTLAAAITTTTATTATLASATGLPSIPFLITIGTECCLVTARTGVNVTAMQRGYNNTIPATHASGAAATVLTAAPDISQGLMQELPVAGNITLLPPVDTTITKAWTLDTRQDATGGWAIFPTTGYTGTRPGTAGDPVTWDSSPLMKYFVNFVTRAAGNVDVTGGSGPFSL
jgi:hypothetical protein